MSSPHTPEETRLKPYICSRSRALLHTYACAYAYAHAFPSISVMMKPSRSFPAACHYHRHHAARFTLARSFFLLSRETKLARFVACLLACYLWRKAYLKHTSYLYSSTYPPTKRLEGGGGKGRERIINVERNFFSSIEKFRLSLWIKRLSGTAEVYGLGFLFLFFPFLFLFIFIFIFIFLSHAYIQTCASRLPYIRISLSPEREIDYCSRLDGRANGD